MKPMRRLLFLALFAALSLDFSTPDALLLVEGSRAFQWDDEEESVPTRRQRAAGENRLVTASPATPRSVERPPKPRWAERGAHVDRPHPPAAWLVLIRRNLVPSFGSASSSEDH
jgi:hypothetical protein